MAETKVRLNFVDMVKGIAILAVVFYHLVAPSPLKDVCTHIGDAVLVAFFFFSGYFYRPGKRTVGENIKARVKSLLGPFVSYSTVFWVIGTIYLLAMGLAPLFEAVCCLRNFYGGCIWNRVIQNWFGWDYYHLGSRYMYLADFWFLLSMFFSSVVFFPLADKVLDSKGKGVGVAVCLFALTGVLRFFDISLPYNIQLVPFWCACMLLGALAGKYKAFEIEGLTGGKEWACALVSLGAGVALSLWKEPSMNLFRGVFATEPQSEPLAMVLCIVASLLIVWGLAEVCKLVEQAGVRVKELSWLGSHSLVTYLCHMFFAWGISVLTGFSLAYKEPVTGEIFAQSLGLTLASLALCILLDILKGKISEVLQQRQAASAN